MNRNWYTHSAAGQEGPFTVEEIRQGIADGTIPPDAYAWRDGLAEWQTIASLPEFSATLAAEPSPQEPVRAASLPVSADSAALSSPSIPIASASSAPAAEAASIPTALTPARRGPSTAFLVVIGLVLLAGGGAFAVAQWFPDLIFDLSGREHAPPPALTRSGVDATATGSPAAQPQAPDPPEAAGIRDLFARYEAAIAAGDPAALKTVSISERAAELDGEQGASIVAMVRGMRPSGVMLGTINVNGDEASAEMTAAGEGAPSGTATFLREDGAWKLARESWRMTIGGDEPGSATPTSNEPSDASSASSSSFSVGVYDRGRATIRKTGDMPSSLGPPEETFLLATGFFSSTRLEDPGKAELDFRVAGAKELSNPRRLELTLDLTRSGAQRTNGEAVSVQLIADGGQIFEPESTASIQVTRPYRAGSGGGFAIEMAPTPFASAGFTFTVSFRITVEGDPPTD